MNIAAFPHDTSSTAKFQSLIEVDMEIDVFGSNWSHCDRLSSYVARMISHNRTDSLLYSNLFSSALNELLETIFRTHEGSGKFSCSVRRNGAVDRVELILPCSRGQAGFYRDTVELARGPDATEKYREMLFSSDVVDTRIGLFELAVDYSADISVETDGSDTIKLIAELALEDAVN
ncbi:ubiquinone biosynthesis methyltransferase UbiE [Rhizobium jaguaris]|uniref:Ubiquinone biosynthesis methyltransferase UbiE n=1 Tax=Rhizobium jaguaris TaxID=1312183 RepID=A0A387FRE9_9HYPH|nr:ubiquinone biosynthesis methyltransferase UbiE [Rhizobium jaguaris]AYG61900.1 ubiquinone biosynthesis methyltransferase UbiE [Rhizobium jaguaris]